MNRRKNGASLLQTKDERIFVKGERFPLARTSLFATLSSGDSVAAPATPRFMQMQFFFLKKSSLVSRLSSLVFSGSPSIVYRLSSFV